MKYPRQKNTGIKISPDQALEMKRLADSGLTMTDIAKKFGISRMTVKYHILPDFRESQREHARLRMRQQYRAMSPEQRKKMLDRQAAITKKRYQTEPDFREYKKQITYAWRLRNPERYKEIRSKSNHRHHKTKRIEKNTVKFFDSSILRIAKST